MTGWRQPPVKPKKVPFPECLHMGVLGAVLTMGMHDYGHEWVCKCGQVFVVSRTTNDAGQTVKTMKQEGQP